MAGAIMSQVLTATTHTFAECRSWRWRLPAAAQAAGAARASAAQAGGPTVILTLSGLPDDLHLGLVVANSTGAGPLRHSRAAAAVAGPPASHPRPTCRATCACADGRRGHVDLRRRMVALPLLERRSEHMPPVAPSEVYRGLEYAWHGLYALALRAPDFPGLQLQVRSSAFTFTSPAAVFSDEGVCWGCHPLVVCAVRRLCLRHTPQHVPALAGPVAAPAGLCMPVSCATSAGRRSRALSGIRRCSDRRPLQELRLRAACSRPHHFHSALVSPSLRANASGHCSVVSVHSLWPAPPQPLPLGMSALLLPRTTAAPFAATDSTCPTDDHACMCLCTAVTAVQLSHTVRAWNAVLPFARLQPQASAPCCAGNIQFLPWSHTRASNPGACPLRPHNIDGTIQTNAHTVRLTNSAQSLSSD